MAETRLARMDDGAFEGEDYCRSLLRHVSEAILVLDAEGTVRHGNPALEKTLGCRMEDLIGRSILESVHPDDLERISRFLTEVLRDPDRRDPLEFRFRHGDGSWRRAEGSFSNAMEDLGGVVFSFRDVIGRREAEEESRRSEAQYRALVENSMDALSICNLDNTWRYVSPSMERVLGYEPEELEGTVVADLVHPEDFEQYGRKIVEQIQSGVGPFRPVEGRYRHKDGSYRYLETTFNIMMDDPVVRGVVVGSSRDVTERKRMEQALKESEERFRSLVQHSSDTITVFEADGKIIYESPSVEWVLGYRPEDMVGKNAFDYIHPDDVRMVAESFAGLLEQSSVRPPMRFRVRHADGYWRYFETVARNLLEDPAVRGIVVNSRDVTERVRAEEELRVAEERFRGAFENAPIGMALVDPGGGFMRVNRSLCRITGYTREELLARRFRDITHPEDVEESLDGASRMLSGEMSSWQTEKRYVRKDGHVVWVLLGVSLIRDSEGLPLYFVTQVQDITERKQAAEEIQRLNETLENRVKERTAQFRASIVEMEDSEELLRLSLERFRSLIQNASDIITILDADGTIRYESPAIERVMGYQDGELIGRNILDYAHPRDVASLRRVVARVSERAGVHSPVEFRFRHRDGSWRYLESIPNNRLGDASVGGVVINSRDVTERKQAEEEVRRSLDSLLALYEANKILSSSLDEGEISRKLLEIMLGVSHLTAAIISVQDERGRVRVWRSVGLESLWPRARFAPEAKAARLSVLETARHRGFGLRGPDGRELAGLCLPLKARERVIGVLEAYGPESVVEKKSIEVLSTLAGQAASALENARLYGEVAEREDRLQDLVGKLITAQEEEQRRVAYEVHDGLAQTAVGAHQHLQAFAERHSSGCTRDREQLGLALELTQRTVTESRRVISDLRPTVLDDFGLQAALRLHLDGLRAGWEVVYEENLGDERLPEAVETTFFRVAQEALTNARKHSGASEVRVKLERLPKTVRLRVRDWGCGFDPDAILEADELGRRIGLSSMRERISLLGGKFALYGRSGVGTLVVAEVPLPKPEKEDS